MLILLVFKLSIRSARSLHLQWVESLQHAEKSVGWGMPMWLQCLSCTKRHQLTLIPFWQQSYALQEQSEIVFCIFCCLLFSDCTSTSKVRWIFTKENQESGQKGSRCLHRFSSFLTSPVQGSLNSPFVNRSRWNAKSLSSAACSTHLSPSGALPCFTDLLQQLVADLFSLLSCCLLPHHLSAMRREIVLPQLAISSGFQGWFWGDTNGILSMPKSRSFGPHPRSPGCW